VSDMDPRQEGIDRLLRSSLGGQAPSLSPDFDRRVAQTLKRRSDGLDRRGWMFLAGYGGVSVATSAVVMHGQGLGWEIVAGLIGASLTFMMVGAWIGRATA
jgi:hypothetical protein